MARAQEKSLEVVEDIACAKHEQTITYQILNEKKHKKEGFCLLDKWYLMKLKSFCKAKDSVNRTKWQSTDWQKIFTNPTSNRG